MAIITNEKWTGRQFVPGERARRVLQVSGVANESAARGAVGVGINTTWPQDNRLYARTPQVERVGLDLYEVTVDYRTLATGTVPPPDPDNPLSMLPTFRWSQGNSTEEVAVDANDKPILNSAGYPFENRSAREFGTLHLTIVRNESNYDGLLALEYQNTVNSDAVIIARAGTFLPLVLRCVAIQPVTEYNVLTPWLPIQYDFEFIPRRTPLELSGAVSPHDYRDVDSGFGGWYSDGGTTERGRFVDGEGEDISEAVLLNGQGKPVFTENVKVGDTRAQPVANPNVPSGATMEASGDAFVLRRQKYPRKPFSALGLFL